jgi:lipopolysaccharide transport system ATP-binding protein
MYRLGTIGTGTLSHDLNRWWTVNIRGKEDPYLRIGETNDRSTKGESEYIWALKDINLEVMPGEVLGIIGKNGAGKSTLLKILSKVTGPTTGSIHYNGRIGSLLEVGTGFHGEMTGRENIFLNGAILGMTKAEIRKKLDEIIDFSGCERYIDTPVKRYSSGMMVRLGFAVAAHLEPEILVVDEVLAVGDAEFQKKAVGKMQDVSKNEGRTVLFVSHNMAAVTNLCENSIILKNGSILNRGPTRNIIEQYISLGNKNSGEILGDEIRYREKCKQVSFNAIRLVSKNIVSDSFGIGEEIQIELEYTVDVDGVFIAPAIHLLDNFGTCILATGNGHSGNIGIDPLYGKPLKKGLYKTVCTIPPNFLNDKTYKISAILMEENSSNRAYVEEAITFNIYETGEMRKEYPGDWIRQIRTKMS